MSKPFADVKDPAPRAVVALHASASSGGQWRRLVAHLAPRWNVLTPDLFGYGKDTQEQTFDAFRLGDEVDRLAPVVEQASDRFHLVGHSYGGLVALLAATRLGSRIKSLVIYEPAAWSIAAHADPTHPGVVELVDLRQQFNNLVSAGRLETVAQAFIDYWSSPGTFAALSPPRQQIAARSMLKVRAEFDAEIAAHATGATTKDAFSAIEAPILYLSGSNSNAPARYVTGVLAPALPSARHIDLPHLGHMGPLTHPDVVNHEIARFLNEIEGTG